MPLETRQSAHEDRVDAQRGRGVEPRDAAADGLLPPSLRRLLSKGAAHVDPDLPPELAFLAAQGIAPSLLAKAARAAARADVSGEAALLTLGMSEEAYYRLLAQHLGAPYLDRAIPLATDGRDRPQALLTGAARLAPNRENLHHVFAPRGDALRALLRDDYPPEIGPSRFTICTPHRLDALFRRRDEAGLLEHASAGLANWDAGLSAKGGRTPLQRRLGLATSVAMAIALGCATAPALLGIAILLFLVFATFVLQRLVVVAASRSPSPEAGNAPRQADVSLPVYTVIVPLFRETRILAQLVRNLDALDYPASKLDIKIMLEACDLDMIGAVSRLDLPARYEVILVPEGHPRTKPRALNMGLDFARGDYVVVYDAEDRPDPGQLRAAVRRFDAHPAEVACLQARLSIDHADETWLTRMFAIEYAGLFHVVKPGLAALALPIPLGGTSNHFRAAALRRVGGWDAWNVTEDIDLGYRLARFGLKVLSLDSATFEEAPLTLARWMPQRSRWLKGWMVTLMVLGREPRRSIHDLGWRNGASVAVSLLGTVASGLLGPPLLLWTVAEGFRGLLFRPETPLWWLFVAASAAMLVGGLLAAVVPCWLGLKRLGRLDLAVWIVTLPVYLLLMSAASWRALFEVWRHPYAWNKTEHGLARRRR